MYFGIYIEVFLRKVEVIFLIDCFIYLFIDKEF